MNLRFLPPKERDPYHQKYYLKYMLSLIQPYRPYKFLIDNNGVINICTSHIHTINENFEKENPFIIEL